MKNNTEISQLPFPGDEIISEYNDLINDINNQMNELLRGPLGDVLQCKPGCSSCCIKFSIFSLEAALILHADKQTDLQQTNSDLCPFLTENICSIYDIRPIICRTQGMALAYSDEENGTVEVSACPLNFKEDYLFSEEEVLFMDEYNSRLYELNRRYCETNNLDPFLRIELAQLPQK